MRVLSALLVLLLAPMAAAADVFRVTGVSVDATAASASEARELALAQGQLAAAQRLIERLTLPDDRAFMPAIDERTAFLLVSGLEVDEEKASGTRYIATISVSFDPEQVRGYLRAQRVAFVESRTRSMVVVALWRGGGKTRLWTDNPWLEGWSQARLGDELVPLVAPTGELGDIAALSVAQAEDLDLSALRTLAGNYGADRVLLAVGSPLGAGVRARLTEVDLAAGGAVIDHGAVEGPTAADAARNAANVLQTAWKRTAVVRDDSINDLAISAVFASAAEWRQIEKAIKGSALIVNARLDALAVDGAMMTLRYRGKRAQLDSELAQRGVGLQDESIGVVARSTGLVAAGPGR